MKRETMPWGRLREYLAALSEDKRLRAAHKSGLNWASPTTVQFWRNREAMAREIRKQEQTPPSPDHWRAVVPLGITEGY